MPHSPKPPPKPLTTTPAPDLDWSRDGAPTSRQYDDIYFSVDGGLEETRAVFLNGCNLPEAWSGKRVFTIGELGFGSGLNFLAAWDLWNKTAKPHQVLHFISVEAYPWSRPDLRRALSAWPALGSLAGQLTAKWPGRVKGVHRIHFGNVVLTLLHEKCAPALGSLNASVDAWFLDGFSPSKNPNMWSQEVFDHLANLSNHGAIVGTFTVAGIVRRGLEQAGFTVHKKLGFGRKRERLEAVYNLNAPPRVRASKLPPVIIGAGVAGASIARGYKRRGITPILIDPETNLESAASGNPAALVMPRLDLQDRPESRFFLSAYLYALRQYEGRNYVLDTGAIQLAKSKQEAVRFEKLISQETLPIRHMQQITTNQAKKISGLSLRSELGGLYFPFAQIIDPKAIVRSWTQHCSRLVQGVAKITRQNHLWEIYGDNNEILATSDAVFITAGSNILDLMALDVRFTRGQICWGKTSVLPKTALTYGGYCAAYGGGVLLGATHDHVGPGQNTLVSLEDSQENISLFAHVCGQTIDAVEAKSRAAVRVTTKDTLPIAAHIKDGLYVMSGLGARGFMMAPLLGEALVCAALGEPSPLCSNTKMRFGAREKS